MRAPWISLALVIGCSGRDAPAPVPVPASARMPAPVPAPAAAPGDRLPLQAVLASTDAAIAVQARRWTDVDYGVPDPIEHEIILDERVEWEERSRRFLELPATERDALIAAAGLSVARPTTPSGAFEGRYITVSIRLPTDAPAALAMLRILDAAQARYVASRMPEARTMTLELRGHWRGGPPRWGPYQLTVTPDGVMRENDESVQLDDADRVAILEWAARLPERRSEPTRERSSDPPPRGIDGFTLTGTLALNGTSRPVVVELGPPATIEGKYSRVEQQLFSVWNLNRGPDRPPR